MRGLGLDRIVGAALGLAAFAAVLAVGLGKGLPLVDCAWRAALALALGFLAGWLVFGKIGLAVMKEAAGPSAPPAAGGPGAPEAPSKDSKDSER